MNYISGARTWVLLITGSAHAFDSYQVTLVKRGVQRLSQHVTRRASPITPQEMKEAIYHITATGPHAAVLTAALLIGYHTLLRQSNLLASHAQADPGHTLQRSDITLTEKGITITVRSTKTRWRAGQAYTLLLRPLPHSTCCPVEAWCRYIRLQRPPLNGPAFILPNGSPLIASTLLGAFRLALMAAGHTSTEDITLHSLRRGGAQACALAGSSLQEIMQVGAWSSSAVFTYVPREMITRTQNPL